MIPGHVKDRVQDFYLHHDISWTAPDRKDDSGLQWTEYPRTDDYCRSVLSVQRRMDMILLTVIKSLCPDIVISKDSIPYNVCLYHENVNLILQGLSMV